MVCSLCGGGMEGSLANKDEAEKCRDLAKRFLQQGEHDKAVRFFEKSLKLYPLPGVETLRDLAKVRVRFYRVRRLFSCAAERAAASRA